MLSPGLSFYQDICMSSELRLVVRLTELIDLHFRACRNCDFYCGQLGYTVRCLNDVTVFHTGKTVYEMIQERLLVEAKRLLVYSRMPVKCIAYELCFTRHDYFSRWFKKLTGYKAKEYRERNKIKYSNGNQIQIK
jgi:AraC family transcriptional activator of pobA